MKDELAFVYIMSNLGRTTFYIGVTNNLTRRVREHKGLEGSKFSRKYKLIHLLYYEEINGIANAIAREKQLKNWHRDWKLNLIREKNPDLIDLSSDWFREDLSLEDPETSSG